MDNSENEGKAFLGCLLLLFAGLGYASTPLVKLVVFNLHLFFCMTNCFEGLDIIPNVVIVFWIGLVAVALWGVTLIVRAVKGLPS